MKLAIPFLIILTLCVSSCKEKSNPVADNNSVESRVEKLLGQMTIEEKIGQMTQAECNQLTSKNDIKDYALGSLLSGGGSPPGTNTAQGWADAYDDLQKWALQSRLKIPIIYGVDAVHGHNNVYGATIFPHNIGLGCTLDADLVERAARITAEEVAATGIDWTFAPCIAVPQDERWGRTYEGFGETAELQKIFAVAAVKGFQTASLAGNSSVLACAKHYVGDGATTGGKDQGNVLYDEAAIRAKHLPGYIDAIKNNVGSIMVSYNSINGSKMHGSKYWITDVLKKELGFTGIVVSDWNGIDQLPGDYKSDIETSINAGIDMVMVPGAYKSFIVLLKQLVTEGKVPVSRIDDAVRRILKVKVQMGLFEKPFTDRSLLASFASAAHKAVARECVRKSLVLLKNSAQTLPLNKNIAKLFVAGKHADNIGLQCGGWSISWQGLSYTATPGTTILQGIKNTVSSTTQVTYSQNGAGAAGYNAAIVVVGEQPYAEGSGDRTDLSLSAEDKLIIQNVKSAGIPVVVVLISGRPMTVSSEIDNADAFVAAWLPGTEGQGVADVLFGDYPFSGKLSHSWPKAMADIPVNTGQQNYLPLYPYGYGLTY
ncbi:MAG: glycoside hydrolase family 3 C-terminal domain-containing protein [Ignavibacteriales bacterium]|nr:glycoside hydrolase family 3 C-terminal domain-containing protein [Ignavibacteriales bacterium]